MIKRICSFFLTGTRLLFLNILQILFTPEYFQSFRRAAHRVSRWRFDTLPKDTLSILFGCWGVTSNLHGVSLQSQAPKLIHSSILPYQMVKVSPENWNDSLNLIKNWLGLEKKENHSSSSQFISLCHPLYEALSLWKYLCINRHSWSFCTGISPHSMACVVGLCWHWGRYTCYTLSVQQSVINERQPARSLVLHPAPVPFHSWVGRHFYLHLFLLLFSVHLKARQGMFTLPRTYSTVYNCIPDSALVAHGFLKHITAGLPAFYRCDKIYPDMTECLYEMSKFCSMSRFSHQWSDHSAAVLDDHSKSNTDNKA